MTFGPELLLVLPALFAVTLWLDRMGVFDGGEE